jgi:hypothetical protein
MQPCKQTLEVHTGLHSAVLLCALLLNQTYFELESSTGHGGIWTRHSVQRAATPLATSQPYGCVTHCHSLRGTLRRAATAERHHSISDMREQVCCSLH